MKKWPIVFAGCSIALLLGVVAIIVVADDPKPQATLAPAPLPSQTPSPDEDSGYGGEPSPCTLKAMPYRLSVLKKVKWPYPPEMEGTAPLLDLSFPNECNLKVRLTIEVYEDNPSIKLVEIFSTHRGGECFGDADVMFGALAVLQALHPKVPREHLLQLLTDLKLANTQGSLVSTQERVEQTFHGLRYVRTPKTATRRVTLTIRAL